MSKPPREESQDAQRHDEDLEHHPHSRQAEEEESDDE